MKDTTSPLFETFQDNPPTLEEAQEFVKGYVEMLPNCGPYRHELEPVQILGNEEAQLLKMPLNIRASEYCGYEVRGNVMLLKGKALWK